MTVGKNRVRLAVEQVEDRCTPSAVLGDPWALGPVHLGGPQATHVGSPDAGRHEAAIARRQVELFGLSFRCSSDLNSATTTVTGFATNLGQWTGQGTVTSFEFNPAADRATVSGTVKVATAQGELFATFSASWKLSTGKGAEIITFTGGTGRYAGATGFAIMECNMTVDLASQRISCNCQGVGLMVLARR